MRRAALALLAPLACGSLLACLSPTSRPRYIVSTTPLLLIDARHPGVCVAVDPADAKGVWWWEPGQSGCSSRSTGPKPFHAAAARVARSPAGTIEASFEIALMIGDPRIVRLELTDAGMREAATGLHTRTAPRATLDLPEAPPPNPGR